MFDNLFGPAKYKFIKTTKAGCGKAFKYDHADSKLVYIDMFGYSPTGRETDNAGSIAAHCCDLGITCFCVSDVQNTWYFFSEPRYSMFALIGIGTEGRVGIKNSDTKQNFPANEHVP